MEDKDFVSSEDCSLSYSDFILMMSKNIDNLKTEYREWYYSWRLLDLAISPMDDNNRKLLRLGHLTGYMECLKRK